MSKYILSIVAVTLMLASCRSTPTKPAFNAAGFNGRWDITIPKEARSRAWWLEVDGAGTGTLTGLFVGAPGGGMYKPDEMSIKGDELTFVFNHRYSVPGNTTPGEKRTDRRGIYRARLVNGKLVGTFEVEGAPTTKLDWTGVRAPVITDRDDGTWKEGKPVALFNGKDLTGWLPMVKGKPLGWVVHNGILTNNPPANNLVSEKKFWNFKLHAEYRLHKHSNSGIGLRGRYEVQILEDYGQPPNKQGHGAIYYRIVPTENASLPAGKWQTLDVTLIGRDVTVTLNGKTVINKKVIDGLTAIANNANEGEPGPITIQGDHRKIEIRKLVVTPLVKK